MASPLTTSRDPRATRTALVTGVSRGLGLALTRSLTNAGWHVIGDARDGVALEDVRAELAPGTATLLAGDVTDPAHRDALVAAVRARGELDLVINNASTLGASPLPRIADLDPETLRRTLEVNLVAPAALLRALLPHLTTDAVVIAITSDAAVEPYAGWGAYGASKAGLDQLHAILGAERPDLHVHTFDPGDLRTVMHQDAFPGEDISDRPEPETAVPALLQLVGGDVPSGRYRASELRETAAVGS